MNCNKFTLESLHTSSKPGIEQMFSDDYQATKTCYAVVMSARMRNKTFQNQVSCKRNLHMKV